VSDQKLLRAKLQHQKWLSKQGLTLDQIEKKRVNITINPFPSYKVKEVSPTTNKFAPGGYKNSIMEKRFSEKESVRKDIENKAKQVAPAFNKGAYQFISSIDDAKHIGKK
jgi:hypothetical protein